MTLRPRDSIGIEITDGNGTVTEYTNKATTLDIVRGVTDFDYFQQVPDVGQLVLKSRNTDLDPLYNSAIKANSFIRVYATHFIEYDYNPGVPVPVTTDLFTGKIINVEVDYLPKDDPEIKINAIDAMGILAEHQFSEEFANSPEVFQVDLSLKDICDLIANDIPEINMTYVFTDTPGYGIAGYRGFESMADEILGGTARTNIRAGENAYDVIARLAQAELMEIVCDGSNNIYVARYVKENPAWWLEAPRLKERSRGVNYVPPRPNIDSATFSTDKTHLFDFLQVTGGEDFTSISADDGYGRMFNSVKFRNKAVFWNSAAGEYQEDSKEYGPYIDQASIDAYGARSLEIETEYDNLALDDHFEKIANNILEITAEPKPTVNKLTFDMTKVIENNGNLLDPLKAFLGSSGQSRYIAKTIVGVYFDPAGPASPIIQENEVVGIRHSIDPENWSTELTFSIQSKEELVRTSVADLGFYEVVVVVNFQGTDIYTYLNEYVSIPGAIKSVPIIEKDTLIENFWWIFGENSSGPVIHLETNEHRGVGDGGFYINPDVEYDTAVINGVYDPNNTFWAGVDSPNQTATTDSKLILMVFKDTNGWYWASADAITLYKNDF